MTPETDSQLANFIWSICNLLRGPYKRNEYRKVILPLTVLRRFDCLLAPTKRAGAGSVPSDEARPETVVSAPCSKRITAGRSTTRRSSTSPKLTRRPEPPRAQPERVHQRLLAQRARDHGAVRLRPADRAHGREESALRGDQGVSPNVDLSPRARGQRADGLRLRGADPHRRRAVERGGRRALHPARGDQADGQPAALAGAGPARAATWSRPSTTRPAAPAACSRSPSSTSVS